CRGGTPDDAEIASRIGLTAVISRPTRSQLRSNRGVRPSVRYSALASSSSRISSPFLVTPAPCCQLPTGGVMIVVAAPTRRFGGWVSARFDFSGSALTGHIAKKDRRRETLRV